MLEFLLFSPEFPRSLRYCLRSAYGLLRRIWSDPNDDPEMHLSLARLGSLLDWLDLRAHTLDVSLIHEFLTYVVDETSAVCDHVSREIQGPPRSIAVGTTVPTQ
jgi:uncharacterized alpha-E superfamily protein